MVIINIVFLIHITLGTEVQKYWFYKDIGQIVRDRSGNDLHAVNGADHLGTSDDWEFVPGRGMWGGNGPCYILGPPNSWTSDQNSISSNIWLTWMVKIMQASSSQILITRRTDSTLYQTIQLTAASQLFYLVRWANDNTDAEWNDSYSVDEWMAISLTTQKLTSELRSEAQFYLNQDLLKSSSATLIIYDEETTGMYTIIGKESPTIGGAFKGFIHSWVVLDDGTPNIWTTYYAHSNPVGYFDDGYSQTVEDWPTEQTDLNWDPCVGCDLCFPDANSWNPWRSAGCAFESCAVDERDGSIECFENCSSNCAECRTNEYNSCNTWSDPNATVDSAPGEWLCNDGYYDSYTNQYVNCQQWHSYCLTWTGDLNNSCPSWQAPAFLNPSTPNFCFLTCPSGYYTKSPEQTWVNTCATECWTCQGADDFWTSWVSTDMTADVNGVWQWADGSYKQGTAWYGCLSPCENCTSPSDWLTCADTQYLQPTTTEWLPTCPTTYWGDDATNTCEQCSGEWATCDDNGWLTCAATYYLQPAPQNTICLQTCPIYTYEDNATNICQACVSPCFDWTGQHSSDWVSCVSTYYLQPAPDTTLCASDCPPTYYGDDATNTWASCGPEWATWDPADNLYCLSCTNIKAHAVSGGCECIPGTHRYTGSSSLQCWDCDTACNECTDQSNANCIDCAATYYMQPPIATSTTCLQTCPMQWFGSDVTLECEEWHDDWETCTGGNQNECLTCNEPNANASPTGSLCIWIDGWFPSVTDPLTCSQWASECTVCFGALYNHCTSCANGFFKQRPTGTSDTCLNSWVDGEYGETTTNLWEPCDPECATCDGPDSNNCLTCVAANTKVVAGSCVCDDHAFMIQASPLQCIVCAAEWVECYAEDDNDSCTTCAANNYKQPPSNTSSSCRATCPFGYFGNDFNNWWEICNGECTSCDGGLRTDWLTWAAANAVPNAQPGECVWDAGYFEVQASPLICIECADECDTWTSANNNNDWDDCSAGHYKQQPMSTSRQCRDNCPVRQYGEDTSRTCEDCDQNWETWFGPDHNNCESCRDSFAILINQECHCQPGSYATIISPLACAECATECETCFLGSNNDCATWDTNYFMQTPVATSQACRSGCSDDEFQDSGNRQCVGCFSECASCSGPNSNEWITCKANGAVVSSGTWVCGLGLYMIASSPLEWIQCAAECDGCSEPENKNACINCAGGSYRQPPVATSTSCRTYCPSGYFGNSSNEWEQCDTTACSECDGPTDSDCTGCVVTFSTPIDGVCEWWVNYYRYVTTGFECINCADEWSECSATTNDDCLVCTNGYYRQPPAATSTSCRATCPPGYFPDAATASCLGCYMDCDDCNGTTINDCISCKNGHASVVNGLCTCSQYYYQVGSAPLECDQCDIDWMYCDGTTNDDCLQWSYGRVLLPPEDTSKSCRSSWPAGYFKSEDCEPCHPACRSCTGEFDTTWYDCTDGYYMQPNTSNTWLDSCPIGYLEDDVLNEWPRCHPTCESCTDLTEEGCSRCALGLFEQPDEPLWESDWADGYYKNDDTRKCTLCHDTCKTWDAALKSDCLTCNDEVSQELEDGQCLCKSDYYLVSNDPLECGRCNASCKTCYGEEANNCYTWEALNSAPSGGEWICVNPYASSNSEGQPLECRACANSVEYDRVNNSWALSCPESSYIHEDECKSCTAPWITCSSDTYCTQCQDGYFANAQFACEEWDSTWATCENRSVECILCSNNLQQLSSGECACPESQAYVEEFAYCVDKTTVSLSVSSDNTVSIEFSRDPGLDLTTDNFELNIIGPSGQLITTTWSMTKDNAQNYKIDVDADAVDILSGSTVNFSLMNDFMTSRQIDQSSQVLSGNLNEELAETALADQEAQEASKETTSSGSTGIISSAAFVSTLSYNFAALWKIINYLQIITLYQFFNMSTTPELDGFLASLLKDSKIPNLYDQIIAQDYNAVTMPERFTKSSYKHPLVLDVFGHTMTIWLLVGFALTTALLLLDSGFPAVQKIAIRIKEMFLWNGIIRIAMETSIYIFLGWFLNLQYGVSDDPHAIVNTLISFGFLGMLSAFCVLCWKAVYKNNGDLDSEKCKQYKELTSELKPDPLRFSVYYSVIFIFRRASLCATVVFIESPRIQICLSGFTNLSYFTWVVVTQPFATPFINSIEIFCEATIVVSNLTMFFFTFEAVDQQILGYAVVFIILGGIGGFMVIIMRNFVEKVREKIKKMKEKKTEGQILPQETNQGTVFTEETMIKEEDSPPKVPKKKKLSIRSRRRKIKP